MAMIAPSILAADFANLERDIHDIEQNGGDWVHVDVMDGVFVPNISIGIPVLRSIRKVTELPLDVHLMITRPIRYVEEFVKAGADWLTIHLESDTPEAIHACLQRIRACGCKAGLSLKPGTPAEAAMAYLDECDMLLVMTVEPGFGGQKFMAEQLPKLRTLRQAAPRCLLQIDGGVDETNCEMCKENGADVLVAGSAYFRSQDRAQFVKRIRA